MKRFESFLNENYRAVNHVTKRPDMQDHAKDFRRMVKNIKSKPGHEILLSKTKEDPEYTKRTGLGDSSEIKIRPFSGKPLGKPWTEKRGNREYTYEVIAISESTQSRIHAAHQKAALNAIKPKMFYALAGEVIYGPYKSKADAHKGEGGAYEEILSSTELTKRIKKGTLYTYEIDEAVSMNEELEKTVAVTPRDADELMKTYTPAVTAVLRKYGLTPGSGAKETVRKYTVELEFPDYRLTWSKTNKGGVTLALRVTKKEKSGLGGKYTGSLKNIVKEIDRVGKQLS